MSAPFPVNDHFIRLLESGYVSIQDSVTLSGGNRLTATIDCQFDSLPGTTRSFFGKNATADFAFTVTSAGIVSFVCRRASGDGTAVASTDQAIEAGRRYIFLGTDDGEETHLYINGDDADTVGTPGTGAIVSDATPFFIGAATAGGSLSALRLFACEIVVDDVTVCRLYIREESGTTLFDSTIYENDGTVSGTEGTDFYYGQSMNRGSVMVGGLS